MIFRLLALLALLLLVYWSLNSIAQRFALNRKQSSLLLILGIVLTVIILMILLGRLPIQFIIAPIGVAVTYLLRMLPTLIRLLPLWQLLRGRINPGRFGSAGMGAGQVSRINTAFLAMELQHASGDMDGKVLQGRFAGQQLSRLALAQLLELAQELVADNDSAQILEAYLDRAHPGWRDTAGPGPERTTAVDESRMTRALALEILGLSEPVTWEMVVQAHRKLMQKLHPDRGGSDYLAKKINSARDFLQQELAA